MEQECEETPQSNDVENAKGNFRRRIKWWCGYVVNWKTIKPKTELTYVELNPMDDLLQLDVGRVCLKIIQEDKGKKEFWVFPTYGKLLQESNWSVEHRYFCRPSKLNYQAYHDGRKYPLDGQHIEQVGYLADECRVHGTYA